MHALVWLCACVERRLIGKRGCNAIFFENRQRSFESIALPQLSQPADNRWCQRAEPRVIFAGAMVGYTWTRAIGARTLFAIAGRLGAESHLEPRPGPPNRKLR